MNNLEVVPNWSNITENHKPEIISVDAIDKPMIVNSFDASLDPFTEIQK